MTIDGDAHSGNPDIKVAEPVYDYGEYVETKTTDGELGRLSEMAETARRLEHAVEEAQRALKKLQDEHRMVVEQQIPELMDSIGMEKFSTKTGLNIAVRESIRASLGSGTEKERNIKWLEENGHEAVVKMAVVVPFGRGEEQRSQAAALAKRLEGEGLDANFERKVEPSTLSSLIRELLEQGQPVPEEAFHVHRQRTAKIT